MLIRLYCETTFQITSQVRMGAPQAKLCMCVCGWHIFSEPSFHITFLQRYLASTDTPKATRRQYPALGRYRTLSATTNPTRKNRLEAGRKGTTSRTNDIATSLGSREKHSLHFLVCKCSRYWHTTYTYSASKDNGNCIHLECTIHVCCAPCKLSLQLCKHFSLEICSNFLHWNQQSTPAI